MNPISGKPEIGGQRRARPSFEAGLRPAPRDDGCGGYCNTLVPPPVSSLICIGIETVPSGWNSILPPTASKVLIASSSLRIDSPVIGGFFFLGEAIAFPVTPP